MKRKSINVPLSEREFDALYENSQENLRHPRDHARWLLRSILLGEPSVEMNNRHDAKALSGQSVTAVGA